VGKLECAVTTGATTVTATRAWSRIEAMAVLADAPPLMLPALQALQNAFGYVHPDDVEVVAERLNVSRAEVHGVLTFYADLRTTAPGRTVVRVCRGEACQAMGAQALVAHAQRRLGIKMASTSADGEFTLDEVFCLGNCALSPAVMTNETLHGRVSHDRFDALVHRLASAGQPQ
jgi:formate dehydrogenase subunit gamma